MKTTVIIPTKNRPQPLNEMLSSLLAQTHLPDELIIIDQSPSDESKSLVNTLIAPSTIRLNYIHDQGISGAAAARNRGIDCAQGDIIFFFDDDVILEQSYIEKTLDAYNQLPTAAGIGGVITNYAFLNQPRIKIFQGIFLQGIFKDKRPKIYRDYHRYKTPIKTNKISGGCASYRTKIIAAERFDETFDKLAGGYSFGEDIELSLRLSANHNLYICPQAHLKHHSLTISTQRKTTADILFLEAASSTYIFRKEFSKNILHWVCYLWLCFGWILRGIAGIGAGKNKALLTSVIKGLNKGRDLSLLKVSND